MMNDNGNAVAVWVEGSITIARKLYVKKFVQGQGWQPAEVQSDVPSPELAIVMLDPNENMILRWINNNDYSISSKRFLVSSGWQAIETLRTASQSAPSGLKLQMDAQGRTLASWANEFKKLPSIAGTWDVTEERLGQLGGSSGAKFKMASSGGAAMIWIESETLLISRDIGF